MDHRATCFVDMPYGKKPDLAAGVEVDFDRIYNAAILPAIEAAGLTPVRADHERCGGVIHTPMFGRLLLSDYVVVDMTLANPNVFYEMGIRHTARPFTTVPIFATTHNVPFDVSLVRSIPYALERGYLTDQAAAKLKADILARLEVAIRGAASNDSPLFQLIPSFPAVAVPGSVAQIFRDEAQYDEEFRRRLAVAQAEASDEERKGALREIERGLGDLKTARTGSLVGLMIAYRDVEAFEEAVALSDGFPDALKSNVFVRQQRALALNRRRGPGDREQALEILRGIVKEKGVDPETQGLVGRVYKDMYKELKGKGNRMRAAAALDGAIEAYREGFKSDPRDYYPGVNAVTLLVEKGDEASLREATRLATLVSFAVERSGGDSSNDYWVVATALELSVVGEDWAWAYRVLPKVLSATDASFKIGTTLNNLKMLRAARERCGKGTAEAAEIINELQARFDELKGAEAKPEADAASEPRPVVGAPPAA